VIDVDNLRVAYYRDMYRIPTDQGKIILYLRMLGVYANGLNPLMCLRPFASAFFYCGCTQSDAFVSIHCVLPCLRGRSFGTDGSAEFCGCRRCFLVTSVPS
jgi:hypothetical protein